MTEQLTAGRVTGRTVDIKDFGLVEFEILSIKIRLKAKRYDIEVSKVYKHNTLVPRRDQDEAWAGLESHTLKIEN
jgi:hypothetical protein